MKKNFVTQWNVFSVNDKPRETKTAYSSSMVRQMKHLNVALQNPCVAMLLLVSAFQRHSPSYANGFVLPQAICI